MSDPPSSHYAADFTSINAAKEGTCENCGTTEVLKHMHNKDRSKLGRDLCPGCYQYYLNKNSTIRRSSGATSQVKPSASYRRNINKSIAQAQRGCNSDDVQAVGHQSDKATGQGLAVGYVMNTSSGPLHMPGPSIHLPGKIPQHTVAPSIHLPGKGVGPQPIGYTHVHAAYPAVRHQRIQEAYSTYNGEVVVVEVRMVLKPPGSVQERVLHDLIEAVDHIPVHIGVVALKGILYNAIILKWNAWTNNFPLQIDDIIMRNKMWVELRPNDPDCDAIARNFFKIGKKGSQTFKTGKTIIYFHVPNEIYNTLVAMRETEELEAERKVKRRSVARNELSVRADFTTAVGKGKKRARSPLPTTPEQGDQDSTFSDIEITNSITRHVKRRKDISDLRSPEPVTQTRGPTAPRSCSETWSGAAGTSMQTILRSRPPSPSAEHISQALKTQRLPTNKEMSPFLCPTTFNVIVYPVEHRTWAQLLDQPTKPAQISVSKNENNFYLGKPLTSVLQLDLTPSNMKKGGFKLAVFGTSIAAIFKREDTQAQAVCAKRVYQPIERVIEVDGALKTKVVDLPHEGEKQFQYLTMEVSCLVWAQALLDMVYDFIKERTEDSKLNSPFHIPQLRFVKAAIAIEQSLSATRKKTTFLLEEVIDVNIEGTFRKYLNNVSPEPLVMETKEDEVRAKFLAFSQHVQYWKTKKQVFVSDYQGGSTLLTDPQISSAGTLGPIFADGNVPSAHRNFETKHRCNYFCRWFDLPISNYDEA